jgi:hypothetical protein
MMNVGGASAAAASALGAGKRWQSAHAQNSNEYTMHYLSNV